MISKPGPVIHSYQVNTTTETSEEGRNRDDRKNQKNQNPSSHGAEKESAKKTETSNSAENDSLPRQLIDSEKVVELLGSTPSTTPVGNPFSKAQKLPLVPERKKVNRNL